MNGKHLDLGKEEKEDYKQKLKTFPINLAYYGMNTSKKTNKME